MSEANRGAEASVEKESSALGRAPISSYELHERFMERVPRFELIPHHVE